MKKLFQTIEQQFKGARKVWIAAMGLAMVVSVCSIYYGFHAAAAADQRIYLLSSGKVLEAVASEREENLTVEARDHLRMFHRLFFDLDPDEKLIRANIGQALYLADGSAKKLYDDQQEKGWIGGLVSGNISQSVELDSIVVDLDVEPYVFRCVGVETLTRATNVTTRSLVTRGFLRNVQRSDNNPHGLLIERFEVVENKDLKTVNR
jgi:conjugative transposon TraK protein